MHDYWLAIITYVGFWVSGFLIGFGVQGIQKNIQIKKLINNEFAEIAAFQNKINEILMKQ